MLTGGMDIGLAAAQPSAKSETEDEKLKRMRSTLDSLVAERERLVKRRQDQVRMRMYKPTFY